MCLSVAGTCPLSSLDLVPVTYWVRFFHTSQPATLLQSEKNSLSLSQCCCEGQIVSLIFSLPICSHFFSCTLETLIISALLSLSSHPSQIALRKYLTELCYHNRQENFFRDSFSLTFLCVLFLRLLVVVVFQGRVLLYISSWLWFVVFLLQPSVLGLCTCTDCTTNPNCDALLEFTFLFVLFVCFRMFLFLFGGMDFLVFQVSFSV